MSRLFFRSSLTIRQILTRRLLPLGLAGLALAGVVSLWASRSAEAGLAGVEEARPVQVLVARATTGAVATRTFTGRIEARRAADLGFVLAGELDQVEVRDGQRVPKGAPLARLDVRRLEARRAQLEAQRAEAQAVLAEMEAGPRAQTVAAARARVNELQTQLALLRRKADRRTALRADDVISQEALDEASSSVEAQAARLESARRDLDLLEAGTRSERLVAQRARVEHLESSLAALAVDLADSVLTAPFAGVVSRVAQDEGSVVAAGQPVLRLVETEELEAWVGVAPRVAAGLRVGQRLVVRTPTGQADAELRSKLPDLDPRTRTVTCVLTIADPAGSGLVPEQVVHVGIPELVEAQGFWLPLDALDRGERDLWSCFVVTAEGTVERRDLTILHLTGEAALVSGHLRAGERVVSGGVHRLVPGERVVVPAGEARP
jgi:multidrug efflux pump subunit AcrA (membrane-fusion protein)